jgi:hypothetical protein
MSAGAAISREASPVCNSRHAGQNAVRLDGLISPVAAAWENI